MFSDNKSCNVQNCSAIICNVLGHYFRKDLVEDKMLITDSLVLTKINLQRRQLHTVTWKTLSNEKYSTIKFWVEVYKYKDACEENPLEDICKFALTILCLPYFNKMKFFTFCFLLVYGKILMFVFKE